MIEAPIFHVNGDDPEAVVYAAKVATEFRQKFQKPVVIDMFCYRRFGHNEGDEPAFTQPLMYKAIRAHPSTLEIYAKKLIAEGVVTEGEVEKMKADWRARLEAEYEGGTGYKPNKADWLDGQLGRSSSPPTTSTIRAAATPASPLDDAEGDRRARSPRCRRASTSTARSSASSTTAARRSRPAKASTGRPARRSPSARCCSTAIAVRLSGQDSERGTFSQRHSVLIDQESEARHTPFNHLAEKQGTLRGAQLDALGRGRARLRVRLHALRAERAHLLGGAVRRLRQRRAGRVRPVHLVGRAQVAAHVRPRLPAAARLRGTGAGAFLRPPRALPANAAPKTTCRSRTARRRRTTSTSCAAS